MNTYKGIYYGTNPWAIGEGDYQDLLGMEHEPALIIYTPDIECYTETEEDARAAIDEWIEEHGDVEEWMRKEDARVFGPSLSIVK